MTPANAVSTGLAESPRPMADHMQGPLAVPVYTSLAKIIVISMADRFVARDGLRLAKERCLSLLLQKAICLTCARLLIWTAFGQLTAYTKHIKTGCDLAAPGQPGIILGFSLT